MRDDLWVLLSFHILCCRCCSARLDWTRLPFLALIRVGRSDFIITGAENTRIWYLRWLRAAHRLYMSETLFSATRKETFYYAVSCYLATALGSMRVSQLYFSPSHAFSFDILIWQAPYFRPTRHFRFQFAEVLGHGAGTMPPRCLYNRGTMRVN